MSSLLETIKMNCCGTKHAGIDPNALVHPGQTMMWRHTFDRLAELEAEGFIKVWHKTPRWWRVSVTTKGWSHVES